MAASGSRSGQTRAGNRNRNTSASRGRGASAQRTARSSGSARSRSASGNAAQRNYSDEREDALKREVWLVLGFAAAVLLFLCNIMKLGSVGEAISGFLFGVFGFLAYIAPLGIFAAAVFAYANRRNPAAARKLFSAIALFLLAGVICDLAAHISAEMDAYSAKELYLLCGGDAGGGVRYRRGGGVLSGSIAYALVHTVGTVGCVLLVIAGIVVCLILLTERSLIRVLQSGGSALTDGARQLRADRAEARERIAEQRRLEAREAEEPRGSISGRSGRAAVRNPLKDDPRGEDEEPISVQLALEEEPGPKEPKRTLMEELREKREIAAREREEDRARTRVLREEQRAAKEQQRAAKEEQRRLRMEEREAERILNPVPAWQGPEAEAYGEELLPEEAEEPMIFAEPEHSGAMHEIYCADPEWDGYVEENDTNVDWMGSQIPGAEQDGDSDPDGGSGFHFAKIPVRESHRVTLGEPEEPLWEESSREDLRDGFAQGMQEATGMEGTAGAEDPFGIEGPSGEKTISAAAPRAERNEGAEPPDAEPPLFREQRDISPLRTDAGSGERNSAAEAAPDRRAKVQRPGTAEAAAKAERPAKKYQFPPLSLLNEGKKSGRDSSAEQEEVAERLLRTLDSFGVHAVITDIIQGPAVTRYEIQPDQGIKVAKVVGLADDIKLNLAALDIRIAPVPGKDVIGIDVPNRETEAVALRDILSSRAFQEAKSSLSFGVGKDIEGQTVVTDIAKMPHVLIAGATGSGKSVCINTLILSLLYKAAPTDVQLVLVDPKVVELSVYNGIPHLALPVVTDPKKAAAALQWGVKEMMDRFGKFADENVRNLQGYNEKLEERRSRGEENVPPRIPQVVIIIDELADLMMVAQGEVEDSIVRLTQLARAAGIHLVVATQRPSVDVITGLIKANMPSRIAFAVSSGVDSRTILDQVGAEKLLGRGDMLFKPQDAKGPARVQGAFVSDDEVSRVVDFLVAQKLGNPFAEGIEAQINQMEASTAGSGKGAVSDTDGGDGRDELFAEAGRTVIASGKSSIGYLQRAFKIGFNRAARIMDSLAEYGVVSSEQGTKAREILMTEEEFEALLEEL